MQSNIEYSASEIRTILQRLFPHRRLVLSQFTFFNQSGVAKPTGETFRRGRRCYRPFDILSIAAVLALKEEGIPYKNIEPLPAVIQQHSEEIFRLGSPCRVVGYKDFLSLELPARERILVKTNEQNLSPLDAFAAHGSSYSLFWSFDVGALATQLERTIEAPAEVLPLYANG